jgi:hypothetical protein
LDEGFKHSQAATTLRSDELGAVLASFGREKSGPNRLAAVVALLANKASDRNGLRGAFAGAEPMVPANVRSAFTTALHSCLREQAVNAVSPAITRSA